MSIESDKTLICRQCKKEFVFSVAEQHFFKEKGFTQPLHCNECRINRRIQSLPRCAHCGIELQKGAETYCTGCFEANGTKFEHDINQLKTALTETQDKLKNVETDRQKLVEEFNTKSNAMIAEQSKIHSKTELRICEAKTETAEISELLLQEQQKSKELERTLNNIRLDLENLLKQHKTLDLLETAFLGFEEKLESLTNKINIQHQQILALADAFKRKSGSTGISCLFKRFTQR